MPQLPIRNNNTCQVRTTSGAVSSYVVPWGFCTMPPTTIITLSTSTRRLVPQRHQKTSLSLWAAHTGITAELKLCRAASLGEGGGERWLGSVFAAGRVTVGVRGSLSPQLRHSLPDWLSEAQRKGLMRRTRKHRGIWQRRWPFPPHPEGQQSCSVAARGGKQGAHCDLNTDWGGRFRLPLR